MSRRPDARHGPAGVEAPVYLAPHQAQQGAQEDRVLLQETALQVCDGLEGVDAAHLQGRTPRYYSSYFPEPKKGE